MSRGCVSESVVEEAALEWSEGLDYAVANGTATLPG